MLLNSSLVAYTPVGWGLGRVRSDPVWDGAAGWGPSIPAKAPLGAAQKSLLSRCKAWGLGPGQTVEAGALATRGSTWRESSWARQGPTQGWFLRRGNTGPTFHSFVHSFSHSASIRLWVPFTVLGPDLLQSVAILRVAQKNIWRCVYWETIFWIPFPAPQLRLGPVRNTSFLSCHAFFSRPPSAYLCIKEARFWNGFSTWELGTLECFLICFSLFPYQ